MNRVQSNRFETRRFQYEVEVVDQEVCVLEGCKKQQVACQSPGKPERAPPRPGGAIDPEANEIVEGNGEQDDADVQFLAIGIKGKAEGEQDEIAQVIRGRKVEKQQNG